MEINSQQIQERYLAFCNTPVLWKGKTVYNLKQLQMPDGFSSVFLRKLEKRLRLGQLAEQFAFNQIESTNTIDILAENLQIQSNKQTLGEIDVLIKLDEQPVHVEIVYKFYVYDDATETSEIEGWIGPNRKDSLQEKITKLKEKQLPLLYSEECKSELKELELTPISIEQNVLFKAQLYVPYQQEVEFKLLNSNCLCGFYINTTQLEEFKNHKFYIPSKLDWFLEPNYAVEWIDFKTFKNESQLFLDHSQSPLFWTKNKANELTKGFLVWW